MTFFEKEGSSVAVLKPEEMITEKDREISTPPTIEEKIAMYVEEVRKLESKLTSPESRVVAQKFHDWFHDGKLAGHYEKSFEPNGEYHGEKEFISDKLTRELTGKENKVLQWRSIEKFASTEKASPKLQVVFTDTPEAKQDQLALRDILDEYNAALNEHHEKASIHDSLTGLYNRKATLDAYQREIKILKKFKSEGRNPEKTPYLVNFDIDEFKEINDTEGHPAGDEKLIQITGLIKTFFKRDSDIIARPGGDEFIIMTRWQDQSELVEALQNLNEAASKIVKGLSIGFSIISPTDTGQTTQGSYTQADTAMYKSKRTKNEPVRSIFLAETEDDQTIYTALPMQPKK